MRSTPFDGSDIARNPKSRARARPAASETLLITQQISALRSFRMIAS